MGKKIGRPPRLIESLCMRIQKEWIIPREPGARMPTESALSDHYQVSRGTIRAVLAKLEKQRFIVRKTAKGAYISDAWSTRRAKFKGKQIGLALFGGSGPLLQTFWNHVITGMHSLTAYSGINLVLGVQNWKYVYPAIEEAGDHFNLDTMLGVVLMGPQPAEAVDSILGLGLPSVAVDFDARNLGVDSFCLDNEKSAGLLARRLHKLGHRKIISVVESPRKPDARKDPAWTERREGFLKEWKMLDAPPPLELCLEQRADFKVIEKMLDGLFQLPADRRPTAMFSCGGGIYSLVNRIAGKHNLQAPRDFTVMDFGHLEETNGSTGIRFDAAEMGKLAIDHLMNQIRENRKRPMRPTISRVKGRYVAGDSHAQAPES